MLHIMHEFLLSYLFLVLFLIISMIYIFINHKRKLKINEENRNIYYLSEYTRAVTEANEEIIRFIREYSSMINDFKKLIDEGDFDALKNYIDLVVTPVKNDFDKDYTVLKKMEHIKDIKIKGIIYQKIIHAKSIGINISFDIITDIADIPMDTLDISAVWGNLLDNAIDAAIETEEKSLYVGLYQGFINKYGMEMIIMRIANSCQEKPNIDEIFNLGYSTKNGEKERGTGLFGVEKILSKYSNCTLETYYDDRTEQFTQEIKIKK